MGASRSGTGKAPAEKPADDSHDTSRDDARAHIKNRLFELNIATTNEDHEGIVYRIRVKTGGLEDNVVFLGGDAQQPIYVGLVAKKNAKGVWSAYGWGHIPAPADFAREIYDTELKKLHKEEPEPAPAAPEGEKQ